MIDQVGRRLRHTPGAARGAEPVPLAAEGDQLVMPAVAAAQPQEAVGQDAVFEEASNSSFTNCGRPALASACSKKVAAWCCTKQYNVVFSGR